MCKFNIKVAMLFGVNAAIVAQLISDCLNGLDYENLRETREETFWCRCSMTLMTGYFPFLTKAKVKDAIELLHMNNVIRKSSFNQSSFDRTNWYSFTPYGEYLMKGLETGD